MIYKCKGTKNNRNITHITEKILPSLRKFKIMTFRLKDFMQDQGIPQAELMELLGYSQSNISKIVTGRGRLPEAKIPTLSKKYGEELVAKYISEDSPHTENITSADSSTNYGHHNNVNTDSFFTTMLRMIDNYMEKEKVSQKQVSDLIEQNHALIEQNKGLLEQNKAFLEQITSLTKLLHEGNITD